MKSYFVIFITKISGIKNAKITDFKATSTVNTYNNAIGLRQMKCCWYNCTHTT